MKWSTMQGFEMFGNLKIRGGPGVVHALVVAGICLLSGSGCAHTAMRWKTAPTPNAVTGLTFILVSPGPALPPDSARFGDRLLTSVRELTGKAELAHGTEESARRVAIERGGSYLLNAKVVEWRDADTQYSGEPDRVKITLRLIDLQQPGGVREMEFFKAGAHFAFSDAPTSRLLDGSLRLAIRRLFGARDPR